MFHPRLVLHPTDLSDSSQHAFALASELAQQYHATLLVLRVVETLGPENVTYAEAISVRQPEGYRERLWAELHRHTPAAHSRVPLQHLLAEGDPAAEIVRVAAERGCDLIVMGIHEHSGLLHALLGSTAEGVVRDAPCPVLTVRLPRPSPAS